MESINSIPPKQKELHAQLESDVERFLREGGEIKLVGTAQATDDGHCPESKRMQEQSRKNAIRTRALNMDQAREIRQRFNGTRGSINRLAKEFGVSKHVVCGIVNGRSYTESI